MSDPFILVFLDDATLDVVSVGDNLVGRYEGVDVEAGEYTFFDHEIKKLTPRFTKPNAKGSFLGLIKSVASGEYELVAGERDKVEFLSRLGQLTGINPNARFQSLDEIRKYVEEVTA